MSEQPSASTDAEQWPGQNASIDSSAHLQLQTPSHVVFSTTPNERVSLIKISPFMDLNGCMDFIGMRGSIGNVDSTGMRRLLRGISTNMTVQQLSCVLNGYADLLQNVLFVIPFFDEMVIDYSQANSFAGVSGAGGQDEYQYVAIILHDTSNNLFASPHLHVNNGLQTCFHINDTRNITEIFEFIQTPKAKNNQNTTHTVDDDDNMDVQNSKSTSYSDTQLLLESNPEKVTRISAREAIISRFQQAIHFTETMGSQLDSILLEEMPQQSIFVNPDGLSEHEKIAIVQDILHSVEERLQITAVHLREEVVDNGTIMEMEDEVQYDPPKVSIEPTHYQRNRMFSELAAGGSRLVQAGGEDAAQRTYVEIEVPHSNGVQIYVCVGVVTVAKVKHPFKAVVPENPSIDESLISMGGERSCLTCDINSYDPNLECTYLLVTEEERVNGRKKIPVYLVSWKQQGVGIQQRIKDENLRLCKLQFYFCVRYGPGQYRSVSSSAYSSIIEDGDGFLVVTLDDSQPQILSEKGGQTINLLLNVKCRKSDLCVLCNDRKPRKGNFSIDEKMISIISPPKTTNNINFNVKILREEYDDEREEKTQRTVYDHTFNYAAPNGR